MQDSGDISFDASPEVRRIVRGFGRTEDIAFSPDGTRLALASLDADSIAICDVEISPGADRPTVEITGADMRSAPGLAYPHAVQFLDDDTIVVANRGAGVAILRLDAPDGTAESTRLIPFDLAPGRGFGVLHGPNSLAVRSHGDGIEVLIGHRDAALLTRHVVYEDSEASFGVSSSEVLLDRWISVVDGVAVSPDGTCFAVTNPWHQHVLVYDTTSPPHAQSEPDCILRGASYPHGVCFSVDGRHLFVTDAGTPNVHVHARDGDTWRGVQYPAVSVQVMNDDVFRRGRRDSSTGGPKGIDVDRSGRVLAVTSQHQPLAFLDVAAILHERAGPRDADQRRLRYELGIVRAADALRQEQIAGITGSRSYRVAERLRRVAAVRHRFRPR